MICNNFQKRHLLVLLCSFDFGPIPLDLCCYRYFKNNRSLGANDKRTIRACAYGIIKHLLLIDSLQNVKTSWENRVEAYLSIDIKEQIKKRKDLDPNLLTSLPLWLFKVLSKAYGEKKAIEIGHCFCQKAPIYLRVNTLKSSRQQIMCLLKKDLDIQCVENLEDAIKVLSPVKFNTYQEYQNVHFEIQDASCQKVVESLKMKGNERILDFCAGAGGKSLHLCAKLKNKGQVNLFDIRVGILQNAKKRLKKAGAFNTTIYTCKKDLKKLKNKMDIVLADVPCSGSGTLRRTPEQKYKISEAIVKNLILAQREIVKEAMTYLKPSGRLIYSTCSILPQENEEQIDFFIKTLQLREKGRPTKILPSENGGDGFFFSELFFNS